jgi:VCBS repeat-containing protein
MSEVLPQARSDLACAEDSSTHKIYCFGGYRWGGPPYFREIVEYNPATHEVATQSAMLPYPGREALGCAEDSLNHHIYCFGGYNHMVSINDEIDFFDQIVKYDPAGDTLSIEGLRLPTRRAFLPCVEDPATHLIYCFGGQGYPGTWVKYDEITVFTPFGVVPPNSRPVANDDAYSTPEDTALSEPTPGVLGNDSDADGDSLTATLVQAPQHGNLNLDPDGSFVYTPAGDYFGADTFSYVAGDGSQSSTETLVSIQVSPVNDPPVAAADSYLTPEDTTLNEPAPGVLTNDSDADGDSLNATVVRDVQHGTLSLNADGSFTYDPASDYSGPDSFTYVAGDGLQSSTETLVSIQVSPVNDPPVAVIDSYITPEDTALSVPAPGVLGNDSDADGDSLTATLVQGPQHGNLNLDPDGSFVYTPASGFSGTDAFVYRAEDALSHSADTIVSVRVGILIFADGFESGNTASWSYTVP